MIIAMFLEAQCRLEAVLPFAGSPKPNSVSFATLQLSALFDAKK